MSNVLYSKLSDLVGTSNASITTIFREKGSYWSSGWHNGVDIATTQGVSIKAVADGTVVNADTVANTDGFGNRVVIRHVDGKATLYAHMVSTPPVKVGQTVKKGQVIGNVGSTGISTGAHLHFTIIDNYDKNPNIYYKGDLLDPIAVCGLGSLKFNTSCSSTIVLSDGTVKNLGDLSKYYSNIEEANHSGNTSNLEIKVGDIVDFTGNIHYTSATATSGVKCTQGKAKVTLIAKGATHPYHLVNCGNGCTVYGWVNDSDIKIGILVGDTVKVKRGAKTYDGVSLASFVYDQKYTISEISGDRAVISSNGIIVAAVNIANLELV